MVLSAPTCGEHFQRSSAGQGNQTNRCGKHQTDQRHHAPDLGTWGLRFRAFRLVEHFANPSFMTVRCMGATLRSSRGHIDLQGGCHPRVPRFPRLGLEASKALVEWCPQTPGKRRCPIELQPLQACCNGESVQQTSITPASAFSSSKSVAGAPNLRSLLQQPV